MASECRFHLGETAVNFTGNFCRIIEHHIGRGPQGSSLTTFLGKSSVAQHLVQLNLMCLMLVNPALPLGNYSNG